MESDSREARLRFLFGTVPQEADIADPAERFALLAEDRPDLGVGVSVRSMRAAVAERVLGDDPTGTWEDVQKRLTAGAERHAVMDELVAELLPLVEQAGQRYLAVLRERGGVPLDDLDQEVLTGLALDRTDPVTTHVLAAAVEPFLVDMDSPVALLAGDLAVHVPTLLTGTVLTHHVSGIEQAEAHVDLDADLAPFARLEPPRTAAGPLHLDPDGPQWGGPPGWLPETPAGRLLAVRGGADGEAAVEVLDAEPAVDDALVALLRAAYDAEHADEPDLPVTAEQLVLGMLVRDPAAFAAPRPPLTELAAAAGLDRRGPEFVHDPAVWARAEVFDRVTRIMDTLPPELADVAVDAVESLAADPSDPAELRRVLDLLDDSDVLLVVAEELLAPDEDARVAQVAALADRLVAAAGSTPRAAPARLIASLAAERAGRIDEAQSHLRAAAHAASWVILEDRLAWYASDRGDAAEADARWEASGLAEGHPHRRMLAPALAAAARPEPERNAPCWCGSGRKYKLCHRGRAALPPLAERLTWVEHKPAVYLERRGGAAAETISAFADLLAGPDEDPIDLYLDPLLIDVALHEDGWLARFLAERGSLLPSDERDLLAGWVGVRRTVVEIVGISYGAGVTVRDLHDGSETTVATRQGSVLRPGELLCVRIVDDGAGGRMFLGEVLVVPRGRETELRELLDDGDPIDVLDWLADAETVDG